MANICSNRIYCATADAATFLHVLDWLYDNFSVNDLDGDEDNGSYWMHGEFSSKWCFPGESFRQLTDELSADKTLYFRIVSSEPGNLYLEGNVYRNGSWEQF